MKYPFIKGLELSRMLYEQAVRPLLAQYFPRLTYSAAQLGSGSDVLGFDTEQSMDHDWGPRLKLFLRAPDEEQYRDDIIRTLADKLPQNIHGYPVHTARHSDGTDHMAPAAHGPFNHRITVHTVPGFFQDYLRWNAGRAAMVAEWLSFPQQRLRAVTAGAVFHDGLGELGQARERLRWYPRDVWLYLLACQWRRISQEEPFVGRCGQVGDELGSSLVAARLVRDVMRLCFLMERQYAPYIKWLGTAFMQLSCALELKQLLAAVLQAGSWQERETHLGAVYTIVAQRHNDLALATPLPTQVSPFWARPFQVIHADRFVEAILAAIGDEQVRALPTNLGGVDQWVDSTDVLDEPARFAALRVMYAK